MLREETRHKMSAVLTVKINQIPDAARKETKRGVLRFVKCNVLEVLKKTFLHKTHIHTHLPQKNPRQSG